LLAGISAYRADAARAHTRSSRVERAAVVARAVDASITREDIGRALGAVTRELTGSAERVRAAAASRNAPRAPATFVWPASGPIRSPFGERRPGGATHPGIDIGGSVGVPVHAAGNGVVVATGTVVGYGGYGEIVVIDHGFGLTTIYAHLSRVDARVGQLVVAGDLIGGEGCTGACTGPHLHFEVRLLGVPRNPMLYLPAR
jgi:murein DD-endopeptidase MepM/ murein hydrolase activator NlpD